MTPDEFALRTDIQAGNVPRDTKVSTMLSQIQLHFLYNSLTAIGEVCEVDPASAKIAVTDFAHYLRGNLESLTKRKMIPFEDELDHVETYLSMERLCFASPSPQNSPIPHHPAREFRVNSW